MSILLILFLVVVLIAAVLPEDETSQQVLTRRARWADFEQRLEHNRIARELNRDLQALRCKETT